MTNLIYNADIHIDIPDEMVVTQEKLREIHDTLIHAVRGLGYGLEMQTLLAPTPEVWSKNHDDRWEARIPLDGIPS